MTEQTTNPAAAARAVIESMKKSQPGPHIEVLELGFAHLHNSANDEKLSRLLMQKFMKLALAAIDAGALNAAVGNINAMGIVVNPTAKLPGPVWANALDVRVQDYDGWRDIPFETKITRAEFINRMMVSTVALRPDSVLHEEPTAGHAGA